MPFRSSIMKSALHTFLAAALTVVFAASLAPAAPVGVSVNGVELDDAGSTGAGWTYAAPMLMLTNAGPFTISGENVDGEVQVLVLSNVTSEVTLSNLTLAATNSHQCAFSLEGDAVVSLFLAGANSLASGMLRAGLEVAAGQTLFVTHAPGDASGALTVTGGSGGAGIGGSSDGTSGTITISGGTVTATGDRGGAGVGGGEKGICGTVSINGGTVTATGGEYGAGIGGGSDGGEGGNVTISGGTVTAIGSSNAKDIGPGSNGTVSGANIFTGGSIRLGASLAFHAPSNATEQVFCATLTGFAPNGPVTITGLGGYGVNDIYADGDGCIYLWLPNGTHTFQANGNARTVTIANGVGPTGVMVRRRNRLSGGSSCWMEF